MSSRTTPSLWLALCLATAGCDTAAIEVCQRVVECFGDPCSVNQCTQQLEGFDEAELQDALACLEKAACVEISAGFCPGMVPDLAQRCCQGSPARGCESPLCQDVAASDPWPVQCLGIVPSELLCDWAEECDLYSSSDIGNGEATAYEMCLAMAVGYNEPERAGEAALCRQCILATTCEEADQCQDSCDTALIP